MPSLLASGAAQTAIQSEPESSSHRSALILYGSETGNAQDLADEIGRLTDRLRFQTTVIDLDSIDIRELVKHTLVIIAISTTGQGEFPQNARSLWRTLLSSRLRPGILRRTVFTSFGLGDSSYPRYNVVHRMLHSRMVQLGARSFCERGEGNEQHPEGHSAGFRVWIVKLSEAIQTCFPLASGEQIIPEGTFIEPKWKLQECADTGRPAEDVIRHDTDVPDQALLPIRGSIVADITSNKRVTTTSHFQDVRVMDLHLKENVSYGPGAVAIIYPKNFPADVDAFIKSQSWEHVADKQIDLVSSQPEGLTVCPSPLRHVDLNGGTTLRQLLAHHLDILSIPRRSFFSSLALFTKTETEDDQFQRERILELANPELIDELWDYTTRPRRTILEIMPEFPTVKIPWQYACTALPIMRGRQFSIASGGRLSTSQHHDTSCTTNYPIPKQDRVQLLVAIANPPNPIIKLRKRHGVCTRYIATLQAQQSLAVTIQPGYLNIKPSDYSTPMLLISPGTGLAPMRALLHDRIQAFNSSAIPISPSRALDDCILLFGLRSTKADYFFASEWDSLTEQGLELHLAQSRNPEVKRAYVQDLILTLADSVFDLIHTRRGRVFVCGSSGAMPKAVRAALVEVIHKGLARQGALQDGPGDDRGIQEQGEEQAHDVAEAEAYLDRLEKEGRYKQETW